MKVYTYSEARQNLSSVLDQATESGEVRVKRRDGREFVIKPIKYHGSPLNVDGIDLDMTSEEIVDIVREGRERNSL